MPPSRGIDRDPAGIRAPEPRVSHHATAHALRAGERWLRKAGLRLVGYLILAILVIKLIPGLRETLEDLERLSLPWLAAVLVLEVLSETGFVISWHSIVDPDSRLGRDGNGRIDVRLAWAQLGAGMFVPGGSLSSVGAGAWLLHRLGMPFKLVAERQLSLSFLNTAIDAVALVVIGVGLAIGVLSGEGNLALTLLPAALAALGIAAALLAAARATRRAPARSIHRRIDATITTLADAVQDTGRLLVHRAGLRSVVGALGYLCFDVLVLYTALIAIHAHPQPTFGVVVMAYIIGALGGSLPLPASLGTVAGIVGMLIVYGVGHDAAVAAVVLYQAVGLLVPIVGGGIAYLLLRAEFRAARNGSEETPAGTSVIRL
ncbi:MAG TPA: lysylphosphatidylglycerol synthase domain-containing protein [Solirubrobacteraceae bacterium]|jgi:uncharacterized membrane protein YbhN (UPF0104 family)